MLDLATRVVVDPAHDLYGRVLFHSGRFQRLSNYRALKATECSAEIMPDGTTTWFGRYLPGGLVLGDPGARDAAIHAVQACVPRSEEHTSELQSQSNLVCRLLLE